LPIITNEYINCYFGFVAYIVFLAVYINTEKSINAKVPLKLTKRLVRLIITYLIFLIGLNFGLMCLLNLFASLINDNIVSVLRFSLICFVPCLIPYVLFIAYCFNEPFEYLVRKHYINKAKRKIKNANLIKIGITGSYGKTSVKEILKTILLQKYRVLATPRSYNTPMGLAKTLNMLDSTHDVLIAEMGARCVGDIRELAMMIKPNYGVITGINNQHLETFKTIEHTKNTKYELIENLTENGVAFFSSDNKYTLELYDRCDSEKVKAGLNGENNLVTAENIKVTTSGTNFDLVFEGKEKINCSTILLGSHSIKNICLASAVAYKMGMAKEEIAEGINRIQSIGHRLELVKNNKNIVIIDDSYNSNEDGISAAMEVLDMFSGRKIVLTPGLVELGKTENMVNFEYGKLLSKHADKVIVIGKHNATMIVNGLVEGGMKKEDIMFAKNLNRGNDE
ncbi:MAG: UDP-N-acetylmuramoyl-tripeptide--D-alanyl-D-alanine ligase, partial [Firmicutes bacterium]|nr:UDP-N-acetylmuramoyl-tripeptide--D-alanyl-D-alanine ligase [Candidatus Caballimonas caccae]